MYRSHSANNQHVMLQLNVQLKYRLSFIVIQRIYSYLLFFFFFTSNSKDIIHNPFFKKKMHCHLKILSDIGMLMETFLHKFNFFLSGMFCSCINWNIF